MLLEDSIYMHWHGSILNRQRDTFCHVRKKHSWCKNISWRRKTRKKRKRKAKKKTSLFPKEEDSLENKQARQRISPPRSANDLFASLAGWRVGNSRFSRGRKRIVDGTVRSLIPSESRELLAASYLLRSIELLLHLLLSRPPPSSFHFCSFSSHFSPRYLSSFDLLFHSYTPRLVGAVLVFKDLITDFSLILSCGTPSRHLGLHLPLLLLLLRLLLFFHLLLIQPGQPWPLLLFLLFFVSYWQRYAAIPLFHARETRPKRQGSVKEEAQRW